MESHMPAHVHGQESPVWHTPYDLQTTDWDWATTPGPMDQPPGRFVAVASGITGKPLRYFIPDPLKDLLSRCAISPRRLREDFNDPYLGLALASEAARRYSGGAIDISQARRFCEAMSFTRKRYTNVKDLTELRREIDSKDCEIRQEIVFSGGKTASQAQHVFAPHTAIHGLLEMLVEGLITPRGDMDAGAFAAVTGFYAVLAHPFIDGNGRWSRLVAAHAGMAMGSSLRVMAHIVFLSHCKAELIERIWPSACHLGLREYVRSSLHFERALLGELLSRGVLNDVKTLNFEIARASKNRRDQERVLFHLYSAGELPLEFLKKELGLSQRVLQGLTDRIEEAVGTRFMVENDVLHTRRLLEEIAVAIRIAKQQLI